jgi:hypothetical protein
MLKLLSTFVRICMHTIERKLPKSKMLGPALSDTVQTDSCAFQFYDRPFGLAKSINHVDTTPENISIYIILKLNLLTL